MKNIWSNSSSWYVWCPKWTNFFGSSLFFVVYDHICETTKIDIFVKFFWLIYYLFVSHSFFLFLFVDLVSLSSMIVSMYICICMRKSRSLIKLEQNLIHKRIFVFMRDGKTTDGLCLILGNWLICFSDYFEQ